MPLLLQPIITSKIPGTCFFRYLFPGIQAIPRRPLLIQMPESVRNKGFEIILELKEKSGDFTYGASINGSVFNNTVTSLEMGNKPIDYAFSRTEVGKPIGYFRGYVVEGVFQSDFWVKSHVTPEGEPIQPYAQVGDFKFKDLNGDGKIDGQ